MRQIAKGQMLPTVLVAALACVLSFALCACAAAGGQAPGGESPEGEKAFVYGTTGYGVEMEDDGLDPHDAYSGWSCVRYGVGETLFRFNDSMEPEPWLAAKYRFVDKTQCVITLREGIKFTSGRALDGEAVKECLDDLVDRHDRARADMKVKRVTARGMTVRIETEEPCPALVSYLCDPYGAIIDMRAGVTADENVSGTGPYKATAVSPTEISLAPNEDYWGGAPKLDKVIVRSITDGDTLANALQSGEVDACYGLPYASYALFDDTSRYTIASCDTSRTFFAQVNYGSALMRDEAVRQALACGIDREGFVGTLLDGRGSVANGPFPNSMRIGEGVVEAPSYDPERARRILEEAGWRDTDGDGVREKNGQRLVLRWLTYPGRAELPLLAESAQSTLGNIGFAVEVNSTANHSQVRADKSAWDVYASALVTAPTGDPEYFFGTHAAKGAVANYGGYENTEADALCRQLHGTFGDDGRARLGTRLSQRVVDDGAFVFVSYLNMGIVAKADAAGLVPHPCDYYEITADLDKE